MARGVKIVMLAVVCLLVVGSSATEDMLLNVNVKKPVAVVSDKFLSITLDPVVLFNSDALNDIERSTSMAKALAPAYVRIGGPRSNSYVFERGLYPQEMHPDPGYTFSETHWIHVHQWAERSGLDVIACVAPQQSDIVTSARTTAWDPRNALDLISFSDHMGYNTSWQLGYECQTRCDISGNEFGRDVQRLRNMLDAFPRYAERALLAGPDVVTFKTRQQQQYLQDYFNVASAALAAVTWHPNFAGVTLEAEGVSMHHDNLAAEKESFYRIVGRHINKKPLWIAESRPEECKRQFLGALVWARRLGNSAKIGVQVLMRQPDNSNLFRPTPDYWVSMLHKQLVGREVLDTRIAAGNRTHVHFYCHCTRPSTRYERGSLTVFGINLTPTKVIANLKGLKLKTVHKYILLPGYDAPNRMFAETILLNNEPLSLINGKEVPEIRPMISNAEKGVKIKLPSGGIGFWVLPGLNIKTCMGHEDEVADKNLLQKINKRLEDMELEDEAEAEDESSRESTDDVDSDEKKSLLKHQQMAHRRTIVRRSSTNHKHDEEQDERSRIHGARHEIDRMEKMVRRRDRHPHNLKNGGYRGIYEHSSEIDESNSEESILGRMTVNQKVDSGEVIRAKLDRYKKRLAEYENKKKQRELAGKETIKNEQSESPNKGMDTEKVIEALTLITKVESAMKGLEKETEGEQGRSPREAATLSTGDFSDVTAGLPQSANGPENNNDGLLDEVLNTEKAKRTSVPTKIEDQLKALYQLLSEEKDRREGQFSMRPRRALDKRAAEEPALVLGQNGSYFRKRTKADELKERRLERKQRLREKVQELKREKEEKTETQNSNENNFYGFQYSAPLKNFPEGDLYLETGEDSDEKKDGDEQVIEAEEGNKEQQQLLRPNPTVPMVVTNIRDEHEDIWLEEGDGSHMPNEFYENVKLQNYNAKENMKNYGELWEAESLPKKEESDKRIEVPANARNYAISEVVTERQIPESEDRIAKERAMQHLASYYQTDPNVKYDYEEIRQQQLQQMHYAPPVIPQYQDPVHANTNYYSDPKYSGYVDANGYYIDPSQYVQAGQATYQRAKRHINDLEDVLHKEMISQDDNNLRDCQCRVIRGVKTCKDCDMQTSNDPAMNLGKGIRIRRDVEPSIMQNVNEEMYKAEIGESIGSAGQTEEEEITSSEEPEELEDAVNSEISLEDSNEATEVEESSTINVEDQLRLENDSDKFLANRLPRKIESPNKFFLNSRGIPTTTATKTNPQNNKQKNTNITNNTQKIAGIANDKQKITSTADDKPKTVATITNDKSKITNFTNDKTKITSITNSAATSPRPIVNNASKIIGEHLANIRSVDNAATQSANTTPPKDSTPEIFNQKESYRTKDPDTANVNLNTQPGVEKSSRFDRDTEGNDKTTAQAVKNERNTEGYVGNPTAATPILSKSNTAQNVTDAKTKNSSKNIKKTTAANRESKTKSKISNNKVEELMKARQVRLTTRAEALAALKKENESRRAKKMIEASMKIIDSENHRFAEYQKRRRQQLERLKLKLRAKREKMLQQYRDELLEAINESSDSKSRNLHRRHLLDKYHNTNNYSRKNDRTANSEKLAYIMRYRPIRYRIDSSEEDERYIPVVEIIRPYDGSRRQVPSKNEARFHMDDMDDVLEKKETNKDKKISTPLNKTLTDEKIYDANNEEEYRTTNKKRSPNSPIDRYATLDESYIKKPVVKPMDGDSGEYYAKQQEEQQHQQYQHQQEQQYISQQEQEDLYLHQLEQQQQQHPPAEVHYQHPAHKQDDGIPLHMKYNQPPPNVEEAQPENFYNPPTYEQADMPYYMMNSENPQLQEDTNYQEINHGNLHRTRSLSNYYSANQEYEQQPEEGDFEANLHNYQPLRHDYRKSKRSSLKVLEIDPTLYEEEPDYNYQEFYVRPSSRFSARHYRHDPYNYNSRRYKRQAVLNEEEDSNGPLSFSLSLEKSQMYNTADEVAWPDSLIRKKRNAEDFSSTKDEKPYQNASPINKNVKKVYKADDEKKPMKSPRYKRVVVKKSLQIPPDITDEEFCRIYDTIDNNPSKIRALELENHLDLHGYREGLKRRRKRSNDSYEKNEVIKGNTINRSEDPEMDEIWNNIVEIKQDEELLKEFDRKKSQIIQNLRETDNNVKNTESTTNSLTGEMNSTITKITGSTTQANIESMLVDAIPKLENVITGGLKKAENLTGSLEDFIENFDEESETTENSNGNAEVSDTYDPNEGKLSHNVFKSMVGSVKKFFGLVSGIAKIFHGN